MAQINLGISMTSPSKLSCYSVSVVCLLTPLLCVAQPSQAEKRHPLVSFQVPGSQATYPMSINEAQTITGFYFSKSGVTSGFVRDEDGHITTFTVPGGVATIPVSIDAAGDVTGYFEVPVTGDILPQAPQGFVRSADGTITTFGNTINTANSSSFWAQPVAINVAGEVIGNFPDVALASVAFLRTPAGDVSDFTLSDGASYPTVATGLNASGAIVGYTSSGNIATAQGFLWDGQGPPPSPVSSAGVTTIDVTGSIGTFPTAINADGAVVGCYSENDVYQDFVRDSAGVITTLNLPGTAPNCSANTTQGSYNVPFPSISVNDQGTITGYYTNAAKVPVSFVRLENGKFTTFYRRGSKQTIPTAINTDGVIIGYFSQGREVVGFIREP
jgi:hypothetical protein